jgi:hypothetical protein
MSEHLKDVLALVITMVVLLMLVWLPIRSQPVSTKGPARVAIEAPGLER